MKDVVSSSTFFDKLNLKPLYDGESKSEKAATIFFSKACDRAAVLDETTTLTSTS